MHMLIIQGLHLQPLGSLHWEFHIWSPRSSPNLGWSGTNVCIIDIKSSWSTDDKFISLLVLSSSWDASEKNSSLSEISSKFTISYNIYIFIVFIYITLSFCVFIQKQKIIFFFTWSNSSQNVGTSSSEISIISDLAGLAASNIPGKLTATLVN